MAALELDEVMHLLGRFGKWQMGHYCLLGFCFGLTTSWQLFAIIFIGYYNPHHCKLPAGVNMSMGLPVVIDDYGYEAYSSCTMYEDPLTQNKTIPCNDGYQWDLMGFSEDGTMVMEWDLICDRDAWVETSQTVFNVGVVVGFFVFTPWGDKYGRKKVFFITQLFMNVFGVAMAFSPNFYVFCTFQFLTGACSSGLLMAGTVLALEMFPSDLRVFLAPATSFFLALGMITLPLWAYLLRNWRNLQLGISVAGFITLLYAYWCPESLRWLVVNNRVRAANAIVHKAAKMNKVTLPEFPFGEPPPKREKGADDDTETGSKGCCAGCCKSDDDGAPAAKSEFLPYLRAPKPRRYFIIMMYLLFTDNIMYYGLSLMMGALEAMDVYLNFLINSAVEFPAIIVSIICMAYFGRRGPIIFFHMLAAVFMALCGIIAVVEIDTTLELNGARYDMMAAFAFLGKFSVSAAWCVMFVYAQEIFPTNMRNTGLGFVAGAGYIGSIIAPYAVYLFRITAWIPTTIFAVMSVIAGLLTIMVPETMGRDLPKCVEDVASWPLNLSKEELTTFRKNRRRLSASPEYAFSTTVSNNPDGTKVVKVGPAIVEEEEPSSWKDSKQNGHVVDPDTDVNKYAMDGFANPGFVKDKPEVTSL